MLLNVYVFLIDVSYGTIGTIEATYQGDVLRIAAASEKSAADILASDSVATRGWWENMHNRVVLVCVGEIDAIEGIL